MAVAIDVLAVAVKKLSGMNWNELAKGIVGLAATMAILVVGANALDTATPGMIRAGAGLILLAVAIRILVTSVEALGGMDWAALAKGLTGTAVLLGALALFTKFAEAGKVGIASGAGIILLATALKILASAVGDFSKYNWGELAKGMAAIAVGLGLIVGAINLIPPGSVLKAAGVVIIGAALEIIGNAVGKMSKMSWSEIAKGLTVMAVSLGAIALAIGLLPPTSIVSATGILIVAAALEILADAMKKMGSMSWIEIAKSLVVLAASLTIISIALIFATGTVAGSAAILIMAVALSMLAPVLKTLGGMSWSDIIAGLSALAGVFIVIGLAALVLTPIVPVIAALAISIGLLGVAMLAAGVGVLAFSIGLTLLAAAGAGATAAVVALIKGLADALPYVALKIGEALIVFAQVIAKAGPAMLEAMTTVMEAMIDAITRISPKIINLLTALLFLFLDTMYQSLPKMVNAGFAIATKVLEGIAKRLPDLIQKGGDVIIAFIQGIGQTVPRVSLAAIMVMVAFLNSMTAQIRASSGALTAAGWNVAKAIVDGIVNGLGSLAGHAISVASGLGKSMIRAAMEAIDAHSPSRKMYWLGQMFVLGMTNAVQNDTPMASKAAAGLGNKMVDSMSSTLSGLNDALGVDAMEFNPTITPILDLSQVKKDASSMSDLLSLPAFDVSGAFANAKTTSSSFESTRKAGDGEGQNGSGSSYTFYQTNNSPRSLSPIELYRQTDNLISKAKGGN
jgi:hypothetical protein